MLVLRWCARVGWRSNRLPALSSRGPLVSSLRVQTPCTRVFATTIQRWRYDARVRTVQKDEEEGKKPATGDTAKASKDAKPATKNEPLLAEQTVSNKEQRKADWAIIRDMAHYLWPKDDFGTRFRVGLSVGLLIGAKVRGFMSQPLSKAPVDRVCRSSMFKYPSTSNPL